MVLINTVTVEAINTALIALQRGENIVVGGEKGGTVNNINVTNNGTGSGTDVSPQLNALDERVTEVENENERQNERIAGLEGLGIEDIEFEEGSRTLFIYLVNGDVLDVVIPDRSLSLSLNGTTLTLSSDEETLSNVELPFIPSSEKGVANGVATLDNTGRIPSTQMPTNIVNSVNTMTGDVVLNGTNVNYDNQSGSPTLKDKIDAVETKADTQVDWNESNSSSLAFIKNKPTIPAAQVQSDWTQTDSTQKDFIKHKIPIWIVSGTSGSDVTPIDSVTNGSMRPITSNAVRNGGNDILSALPDWTDDPTDTTKLIRRDTNGSASFGQVTFLTVWNYIKSKVLSFFVPKRTNGYLYNPAIANYWGSSGGKYFRIKLPKKSATWAMVHLEVSLRTYDGASKNTSGKLLIHAHWSSTQEWNTFYYSRYGDLPASTAVYGSDKTYIYIYSNTTYTTCSLDRVLLGDNITGQDISDMEIDNVSALPTTYQTAILTSSIPDVGNGQAVSFAYSKAGLTTTPSWLAAWNGYELRAFDPKKMFLDYAYPVGSIYMSTTHTSPQTFLGGQWEEFTDGRFLRASGGNAGTVGNIQAEGLPNITGSVNNIDGTYGVMGFDASSNSFSGALGGAVYSGYSRTGQSSSHSAAKYLYFDASDGNTTVPDGASSGKIYGNSSHVTPKNMAVYMWRRTS